MLSPSMMLEVWDAGRRRHPIDRALLLLALTPEPPAALADVPLGEVNQRLMWLRRARFGDRLAVWADCAACGERMSLEFAADELPSPDETAPEVEVAGHRFRRPTSRDLAALIGAPETASAARQLARACAADPATLPEGEALDALVAQVEAKLDEADPWADLTLLTACPACGHRDGIALDVPAILWDEIAAAAERLLDEVHVLASAYGWSEHDILEMSDARRAAYLTRVTP